METAPLLSVVIPVYNGERFIGTMIDVFRAQKTQNYELIFVDDGSTDSSLSLLRSYARSESFPVTVVELEPKGVSAARNAGLDRVRGKYISFVDVDDRVVPEYTTVLQELVDAGTDFELFFSRSQRVGPEGPFEGIGSFSGSISMTSENMLKKIGSKAREDMERFFGCKINLRLWVKVKEDWRQRPQVLASLGFDKKDFME